MKTLIDRELHAKISSHIDLSGHQGLSVGTYDHGSTNFYGYGHILPDTDVRPASSSVYDIGGISKIFAAALTRQYLKEKKIHAHDRVGKFLSSLRPEIGKLSVSDLLDPSRILRAPRIAMSQDLAYALLGKSMEAWSDRPYETILERRILLPLGLADTGMDPSSVPVQKRTVGSNQKGIADYIGISELAPAIGLKSSVRDLLKYVSILIAPQVPTAVQDVEVGAEWLKNETDEATIYFQYGATPGYSGFVAFDKEGGKALVLLLNKGSQNLIPLGLKLIRDELVQPGFDERTN
jgi:CubicO group peptidase (beta-lactamase class C family)